MLPLKFVVKIFSFEGARPQKGPYMKGFTSSTYFHYYKCLCICTSICLCCSHLFRLNIESKIGHYTIYIYYGYDVQSEIIEMAERGIQRANLGPL